MPWQESSVVSQREEFVLRSLHDRNAFRELCRQYGIAPKTGYKWRRRFLQFGIQGLHDESRRPHRSPNGLDEAAVCEVVRLRRLHPTWGARKLKWLYQRIHKTAPTPSESSFKRVLERTGLAEERRRRRVADTGRLQSRLVAERPNELWTVDFKGWWYTPLGQRCEPLTVRDAFSRYVLCVSIPADAQTGTIRIQFERLFEQYGLLQTIRSDNGRPFAVSTAPLGLSRLSAWWLALGIDLDRIDPGHPQQNGAHERMHRDIAAELEHRIDGNLEEHAAAAELWRHGYNHERPHEALGMRPPAEVYQRSPRRYTGTPEQLEYPPEYLDRKVSPKGYIKIKNCNISLTTALSGWNVGLKRIGEELYAVYFGRLCLGRVDVPAQAFETHRPEAQESSS